MYDPLLDLLYDLDGVRQDPRYHPEGDALYRLIYGAQKPLRQESTWPAGPRGQSALTVQVGMHCMPMGVVEQPQPLEPGGHAPAQSLLVVQARGPPPPPPATVPFRQRWM